MPRVRRHEHPCRSLKRLPALRRVLGCDGDVGQEAAPFSEGTFEISSAQGVVEQAVAAAGASGKVRRRPPPRRRRSRAARPFPGSQGALP